MPWTAPNTYVAGAVLTAAQLNAMQDNLLAGGPTYTTAALRDAAITAPYEGQRAYLTAPAAATVTATGATTAIPSGIQTIYNGSAWVSVTPVGAYSNTTGTTASGTYVTTLTGDATAISVTTPTGTTALITITSESQINAIGNTFLSFSVSGATTVAATDALGAQCYFPTANQRGMVVRSYVYTGLTAGVNTFTVNYKASGGTVSYFARNLTVQGVA